MGKVIEFPYTPTDVPRTKEESENKIEEVRSDFADSVTEDVYEMLINNLQHYGILSNQKKIYVKDLLLLEESIRSMIYRYVGVSHTFHQTNLCETLFVIEGEELNIPNSEENEEKIKNI